jgi:hypothetical protein
MTRLERDPATNSGYVRPNGAGQQPVPPTRRSGGCSAMRWRLAVSTIRTWGDS